MSGMSADRKYVVRRLSALDANVMLADAELTITYMDPAVTALMREAEADLRKEIRRFNVNELIGSNIALFHKNPTYQRKMLATLVTPHSATIRIGVRTLDL